jgi:heme exporter protein D
MSWNSVSDFYAMGGHAVYVWGSFGACLLALVLEPVLLAHRRHAIERTLRRRARAHRLEQQEQAT